MTIGREQSENIIQHNKLISQMSNYDIHDQEHSDKVLEIVHLHDSATAIPKWEYDFQICYTKGATESTCLYNKEVKRYAAKRKRNE